MSSASSARPETYIQYLERTNSIKHEFRPGESLSSVLESQGYSDINGHFGALNQTYWKNGFRRNEKSLKSGTVILLPYDEKIAQGTHVKVRPPLAESPKYEPIKDSPAPKKPPEVIEQRPVVMPLPDRVGRKISFIPGLEEWNISALYGAKYLSVSQKGALGSTEVGVLFLNDLKLNSEFIFEDWSAWLQLDSYRFKYKSIASGDSQQMYSLDLGISYKWIMGSIGFVQNPLFRINEGNFEMTAQSLMYLSLGARIDIELPTRKPTVVRLKGWLHYPLSSSTDNTQVKLSSVSGFGASGQAALEREIFSKEIYSLHATWITDLGYQQLSQTVKWDTSAGKVDSTINNASSTLGLLFKF
ncbi:MAG: hypothetical protein H0V66_08575 [Bdellovibrionales bacterium]|nr:hypothetical protein [Bdellovibrionales bacterium]